MSVQFRNVDAEPSDDVTTWPYEALVTAIDRGLVTDWAAVFAEVRRQPWGPLARRIEHYLTYRERDATTRLFELAINRARVDSEARDRSDVARRVRDSIEHSGRSGAEFAELVGTSASRLSTYATGKVTPSAAMLLRIERTESSAAPVSRADSPRR